MVSHGESCNTIFFVFFLGPYLRLNSAGALATFFVILLSFQRTNTDGWAFISKTPSGCSHKSSNKKIPDNDICHMFNHALFHHAH